MPHRAVPITRPFMRPTRRRSAAACLGLVAVVASLAAIPPASAGLPVTPTYGVPQAEVGLNPWDVAAGDLDGDGRGDVAVVNAGDDEVSVLLNTGGGVLRPEVRYPVGTDPHAIAIADLDGDGAADLVVGHRATNDVRVLRGAGDGTFTAGPAYPAGGGVEDLVAVDLDGDGDPDVAAVTDGGSDGLAIFRNVGAGELASDGIAAPASLHGLAAGDLNGDGAVDLVTSSLGGSSQVFLGRGDGSFVTGETIATPSAFKVAVGDIDGDADLDVVAVDLSRSAVTVAQNHGDARFTPRATVSTGNQPATIAAADVDGDGRAEFLTANTHRAIGDGSWSLVADDGGGMPSAVTSDAPRSAWAVSLAHMDGDALLDLVLTNGESCRTGCVSPGAVTVLLNRGGGAFGGYAVHRTGGLGSSGGCSFGFDPPKKRAIAAGDLDGDGAPDLAVANCETTDVSLLLNDGRGRLVPGGVFAEDEGVPEAIAGGDLDGDGDRDLVVAYNGFAVSVHRNEGGATFSGPPERLDGALRRPFVAVADMNGDAALDVVIGGQRLTRGPAGSNVAVRLNDGTGAFPMVTYAAVDADNTRLRVFAVADLDGDGDRDIVTAAERGPADVRVLRNDGTGTLTPGAPVALPGAEPLAIAAGDTDNDGDVDVAVSDPAGAAVHLLTNDGTGHLSVASSLPAGRTVGGVALADLDGDGRLDLAHGEGATLEHPASRVSVRLNEGGAFGDPVGYLSGTGAGSVLVAQLDRRGGLELVVADELLGKTWILSSGGGGTFLDLDIDLVPDLFEVDLRLVLEDPDSDDDRLLDGIDPDILRAMLERLPKGAFAVAGHQRSLLAKLEPVDGMILKGKVGQALHQLDQVDRRIDGCSQQKMPDADDWVTDCGAQFRLRLPMALLESNLKGVGLPKELLPPPMVQEGAAGV